jgi:tyrosyl-tRNA synthetase
MCNQSDDSHAELVFFSKKMVLHQLRNRNLLQACTNEQLLSKHLLKKRIVYAGFDPTATSLHVGNLVGIITLCHFLADGHKAIALVGGATASIGDPSGKATDRIALDSSVIKTNTNSIHNQLGHIFDRISDYCTFKDIHLDIQSRLSIKNNLDWVGNLSLIDFLSSVGRRARVSSMVSHLISYRIVGSRQCQRENDK